MKCETLDREILWETPTGKQVLIASRRLVSFVDRHVAANHPKGAILASKQPGIRQMRLTQFDAAIALGRRAGLIDRRRSGLSRLIPIILERCMTSLRPARDICGVNSHRGCSRG